MRNIFVFALVLSTVNFTVANAANPRVPATPPSKKQFELVQQHADVGKMYINITENAVRLDAPKLGTSLIAAAPTWTVYYFRNDEKTIWSGSADLITPGGFVNPFSRLDATPRRRRSEAMTTDQNPNSGFSGNQTGLAITGRQTILKECGSGTFENTKYIEYRASNKFRQFYLWGAQDIAAAPGCARVLCRVYGVPVIPKIPLYLRATPHAGESYRENLDEKLPFFPKSAGVLTRDLRAGPQIIMSTASCRAVPYTPQKFVVPSNYKKVTAMIDISYSKKAKQEVGTLLNDIGFVSANDESPQPKTNGADRKK